MTHHIDLSDPAAILDAAADYIEEYGWTQNTYGKAGGPVCMIGAINAVTTGRPMSGDYRSYKAEAIIESTLSVDSIADYNDHGARRKHHVLNKLRRVAAKYRREHAA